MASSALYAGAVVAVLVLARPGLGIAQESATIEILAPVLAAEDARAFRPDVLRPAIQSADPIIRRNVATSIGRVGDRRGLGLLPPLLLDADTTVRAAAVFAAGLIGDTAAINLLVPGFQNDPVYDEGSATEAVTSLARIGGPRSAAFIKSLLDGTAVLSIQAVDAVRHRAALEAWRLGDAAPVEALLPLVRDTAVAARWGAVNSLARLQRAGTAPQLAEALRDGSALVRSAAVRAFSREFADSSQFGADGAASLLAPLLDDVDPGVRINALRSLGALGATRFADRAVILLEDPLPHVRVQAATTLGALGGPVARAALLHTAAHGAFFALQSEALAALARIDTAAFRTASADWQSSPDWARRFAIAQSLGFAGAGNPLLHDGDVRVRAAALGAWAGADSSDALLAAAREALQESDVVVRAVAAGVVGRRSQAADIAFLADAYRRAAADQIPDAAIAALDALAAIAAASEGSRARVSRDVLNALPRSDNLVVRRWVEDRWPVLAARWGPARPITTGRSLQDYREIIRRYVIAPDSVARPHIFIETEQRGTLEVELLGPVAPMTVAHIVALVDRRYFDGNRWHRVVPNFVVQDGDPRGDGWGGPGSSIRDEINRERYLQPVMGMALSGPDSGGSQWFINLSPQPHLDGAYTVFGRVVGSYQPLWRITQGDIIRTIRR